MKRIADLILTTALVAFISGCASMTTIDFNDPQDSEVTIKKKDFKFPTAVRLAQRTTAGLSNGGYSIEIDIHDGSRLLETHGKLYVYKVAFTDVDLLARNYFRIPQDKIESLKKGAAVTIDGFSADGGKLVYRAIIGLKKEESQLPSAL